MTRRVRNRVPVTQAVLFFMKKKGNIDEIIKAYHRGDETDPLGSYTGQPLFEGKPEQDADDL